MKIAVATIDGETVSQHFGQSRGFLVFDVVDGAIVTRELRTPQATPHEEGVCHGGGGLALLAGCEVLICGGMGGGAAASLTSAGIKAVLLPGIVKPEEAVKSFVSGNGNEAAAGFCQCGHGH